MKIVIFAHGKIKKGPELELISGYVTRFNKQFNNDFFTSLEISESVETEKQFNDKVAKMLDLKQSTVLLPNTLTIMAYIFFLRKVVSKFFHNTIILCSSTAIKWLLYLG